MSVRSFRPVVAVASVAAAALSCYLVSLRVAAERAGLEDVETRIVLAQREIRSLQTEIGTRGRLEQLERWNVKVLALSAPKAEQFVDGGYQLARLARPSDAVAIDAPVVLASAPKPAAARPTAADDGDVAPRVTPPPAVRANGGPASLMHVASYTVPSTQAVKAKSVRPPAVSGAATAHKPARKPPENVSVTTKPVKIATIIRKPALPASATDAKASLQRQRAKKPASATATSREKATH